MNKEEKVLEIVNSVITDRLTQLIEEMSDNEFVEMIGDMYFDQTGKNIEDDTDDDEDFDHDGHFHPLEELNYEGEKGKIYIVFVNAGGSEY